MCGRKYKRLLILLHVYDVGLDLFVHVINIVQYEFYSKASSLNTGESFL